MFFFSVSFGLSCHHLESGAIFLKFCLFHSPATVIPVPYLTTLKLKRSISLSHTILILTPFLSQPDIVKLSPTSLIYPFQAYSITPIWSRKCSNYIFQTCHFLPHLFIFIHNTYFSLGIPIDILSILWECDLFLLPTFLTLKVWVFHTKQFSNSL